MLTFGYKASAEQFGPRELLEFSVIAEEVGFDSVVVSDHFQPWRHTGGHAPYLLRLAGGARRAHALAFASGPASSPPPSATTRASWRRRMGTLGSLYPGRVFLGVGTGESMNEVPSIGIEWPEQKERFARLKESITLMQRLLSEDRVTFDGEYYRTHNATIYDRPDESVPLYVAASGPAAAKLAGRVADGFICTSGKAPELYSETLIPALNEGAEKAGRDPNSIERMIEMKVSFDTDAERALQDTRYWGALALKPEEKMGVEDPMELERLADALPVERAASRWIVSSDPEEQIARIQPYIDLGFTHLVFHAPGPDQERFLRLYAKEVLPRLREAAVPAGAR